MVKYLQQSTDVVASTGSFRIFGFNRDLSQVFSDPSSR